MTQNIKIAEFPCELVANSNEKITYIIYPEVEPISSSLLEKMAEKHSTSIGVVYIPAKDWNNSLTPWPEPPEAPGFPPFGGKGAAFSKILREQILPGAESALKMKDQPVRNLIGVSLSGLFTLWDWLQSDVFSSIACLSGSFWYDGFMEWFEKFPIPKKSGSAYFLLGKEEPKAKITAYRSVGVNTEAVVDRLKENGIKEKFEWVPGNHFSAPLERLEKGFENLP